MRRARSVLGALAIVLMTMVAAPAAAHAHAVVMQTSPANWQILPTAPTEVSIRFSEPVDLGLTAIRLIGPEGGQIALGRPTHPAGKPTTVSVPVPGLPSEGTYTVAWRAVSADTHSVQGAFTFSVGAPTGTGAQEQLATSGGSTAVAVLYGVLRWLAFVGFALLVGTAFFTACCWPAGQSRRELRRLAATGWITLVATTVLTLMLYGVYATRRPLRSALRPSQVLDALDSRMGFALAARLAVLAVLAMAVLAWSRRGALEPDEPTERRDLVRRGGVVLAATLVLGYTWALATHSAAGALRIWAELSDAVHMAAMGVWLGGLVVLGAVLLRSGDVAAMRTALPRFSRTVPWCVGVLLITGTFQAWREVGSVALLVDTDYGRFLLAKLALVAGLLSLGWMARAWVHRHYGFVVRSISDKRRAHRGPVGSEVRRLRSGVVLEAGLAAVLLAVTAHLVNAVPASAEVAARQPVQAAAAQGPVNLAVPFDTGSGTETGRGLVAVVVAPATVGANELHLSVLTRAGLPRDIAELQASFALAEKALGPLPVRLQTSGVPGHYLAVGTVLPLPGHWILTLTVRTSDVDQTTLRVPITVGAR